MDNKILVIIPAYNEAPRIGTVIGGIQKELNNCDIVVINDASKDDTASVAKEHHAHVITHPINLGYASAIQTGYLYALHKGYEIIIQLDADGQHLPREIHKLLRPIVDGSVDITFGSRYLEMDTYKTSFVKQFGQKSMAFVFYVITRKKITDPTTGFSCLNKKCIHFFVEKYYPDKYPDVDVLIALYYSGLKMLEVPTQMNEREGGVSMHRGMSMFIYLIKMLLSIFYVILNRNMFGEEIND